MRRYWPLVGALVLILGGLWWASTRTEPAPNAAGLDRSEQVYVAALATHITALDQIGTPVAAGTPYPVALDQWSIRAQDIPPAPQRFTAAGARWATLVQAVTRYAATLNPAVRYQSVDGRPFAAAVQAVGDAIRAVVTPLPTP